MFVFHFILRNIRIHDITSLYVFLNEYHDMKLSIMSHVISAVHKNLSMVGVEGQSPHILAYPNNERCLAIYTTCVAGS